METYNNLINRSIIPQKKVESYNRDFSSEDIDQLIEDIKNTNITDEDLMNTYDVRCIYVSGHDIRKDLLNALTNRESPYIIHFFWEKLTLDDQFNNLMGLDPDIIIKNMSHAFILNYFLLFGDDYKEELITKLEKIYLSIDRSAKKHNYPYSILQALTCNVMLILGYIFEKNKTEFLYI